MTTPPDVLKMAREILVKKKQLDMDCGAALAILQGGADQSTEVQITITAIMAERGRILNTARNNKPKQQNDTADYNYAYSEGYKDGLLDVLETIQFPDGLGVHKGGFDDPDAAIRNTGGK